MRQEDLVLITIVADWLGWGSIVFEGAFFAYAGKTKIRAAPSR